MKLITLITATILVVSATMAQTGQEVRNVDKSTTELKAELAAMQTRVEAAERQELCTQLSKSNNDQNWTVGWTAVVVILSMVATLIASFLFIS